MTAPVFIYTSEPWAALSFRRPIFAPAGHSAGFILPEVRVVLFLPHRELFGTRLIETVRAFVVVTNCAVTTNFYSGGWVVMKKSQVVKRSIVVGGHKTSVSLEDEFWAALKKIALTHRVTLSDLVGSIDSQRQHGNLSSAVRLFVLNHYRQRVEVLEIRPATSEMQPGKSTG
jgi:predicted DNA-binding ribbon-helix-helix protein